MCIIYFENIQCGLVNVYHYLLTGRKKKKIKQSTKTFQRESNFLLFQFAYLYWEGLLIKPVANQRMLFNCDEQHDVV